MRFPLGVADVVRWPFERFAWLLERRLIWPLRERAAGWGPPGHAVGATALAALAAAAVAVGFLWPSGGNGTGGEVAAARGRVEVAPPPAESEAEVAQGPALKGAPPSFGVGKGNGAPKAASGEASDTEAAAPSPPETEGGAEHGATRRRRRRDDLEREAGARRSRGDEGGAPLLRCVRLL